VEVEFDPYEQGWAGCMELVLTYSPSKGVEPIEGEVGD